MTRVRFLLLAVGCWLSAASAQRLETTIWLPDSLGGVNSPYNLVFYAARNKAYVAGGGAGVIVIDGATNQRMKRLYLGGGVPALCLVSDLDRVYASVWSPPGVAVIDCATDSIACTIPLDAVPLKECYSSENGFLYCLGGWGVYAINCQTNQVAFSTQAQADEMDMCYNPVNNRVYVSLASWQMPYDSAVIVVDGSTGLVTDSIAVSREAHRLICVPCENKVYCTNSYYGGINVIDGNTNQVTTVIRTPGELWFSCYNPALNRVYFCQAESLGAVHVIDAHADSVIASIPVSPWPGFLCYSPAVSQVYCALDPSSQTSRDSVLQVIDCATNCVVDSIRVPEGTSVLCSDSVHNRVFSSSPYDNSVGVIDVEQGRLVATLPTGERPTTLCYCASDSAIYVAAPDRRAVLVVDGSTNLPTRRIVTPHAVSTLFYSNHTGKVYGANINGLRPESSVTIFDARGDSVLAVVRTGKNPSCFCANSSGSKVYCGHSSGFGWPDSVVTVIDGLADSVQKNITVGDGPWALGYNPTNNKLYCAIYGRNGYGTTIVVIDASADTVLRRITVGRRPAAFGYNPENNKVYCAVQVDPQIVVLDGATDSVLKVLPLPDYSWPCQIEWCRANNRLFCANYGTDNIAVVDAATDSIITYLSAGDLPEALVLDTVENKLYCKNRYDDNVMVFDCLTNALIATIGVADWPMGLTWNPDFKRLYLAHPGVSCLTVIRDGGQGIQDATDVTDRSSLTLPTIVRGSLMLRKGGPASLLDISGRKVLDLKPGANDVSRLAPGVYFVRSADGGQRSAVSKVVIQN